MLRPRSPLHDLCTTLAPGMQWKVRRTLTFSTHEIVGIGEPGRVVRDRLPVGERRRSLSSRGDVHQLENEQNRRFRQGLAPQLQLVACLYSHAGRAPSILQLALAPASDRVPVARLPAFALVSQMLKQDRVPNVRLARARVVYLQPKHPDSVAGSDSPRRELLNGTLTHP